MFFSRLEDLPKHVFNYLLLSYGDKNRPSYHAGSRNQPLYPVFGFSELPYLTRPIFED